MGSALSSTWTCLSFSHGKYRSWGVAGYPIHHLPTLSLVYAGIILDVQNPNLLKKNLLIRLHIALANSWHLTFLCLQPGSVISVIVKTEPVLIWSMGKTELLVIFLKTRGLCRLKNSNQITPHASPSVVDEFHLLPMLIYGFTLYPSGLSPPPLVEGSKTGQRVAQMC